MCISSISVNQDSAKKKKNNFRYFEQKKFNIGINFKDEPTQRFTMARSCYHT